MQTAAVDGRSRSRSPTRTSTSCPVSPTIWPQGPQSVDADQLDLAVELFTDAADYADDESMETALATSTPLGWYVSYMLNPDPNRLAPNPPFDAEARPGGRSSASSKPACGRSERRSPRDAQPISTRTGLDRPRRSAAAAEGTG